MLDQIMSAKVSGKKAHRWLGYAQCILVYEQQFLLGMVKSINHAASEGRRIGESDDPEST